MTRALLIIGLLISALVVPAVGQTTVLTQADARALIKEYQCYSMRIADAQAVLLRKWFTSVGAHDEEFTNFQANVELARRDLCGEITLSDRIRNYGAVQPPFNGIVARLQSANGLTDTSARLALQESLARYARLLESSCNLQTEKQIATSLLNRMRSLTGGATGGSPPPFNAADFLGSCTSGGGGQIPSPGQEIGSLGNSAKDIYRQCVKAVIADAKPAACATNPYAGAAGEAKKTFGAGAVVARLIALVVGAEYAAAWAAASAVSAAIAGAADLEDQEDKKRQAEAAAARDRAAAAAEAEEHAKMLEAIKKLQEEVEKLKAQLAASGAATPTPTPQPTSAPTPTPQQRCDRISAYVSGNRVDLFYKSQDGGVIGILDSMKACRCKARAIESPSGSRITEPDGSECQSDADRQRADCARNPFDEVDRPRKECVEYLMEDNKSFNVEARLCSAVQCTRYSKTVGLSANRVLACGCLVPILSPDGTPRMNLCSRMICQGECVCRGTMCACEGSETRIIPHTPPSPPVQPTVPEGFPGINPRPPLP